MWKHIPGYFLRTSKGISTWKEDTIYSYFESQLCLGDHRESILNSCSHTQNFGQWLSPYHGIKHFPSIIIAFISSSLCLQRALWSSIPPSRVLKFPIRVLLIDLLPSSSKEHGSTLLVFILRWFCSDDNLTITSTEVQVCTGVAQH